VTLDVGWVIGDAGALASGDADGAGVGVVPLLHAASPNKSSALASMSRSLIMC